MTCSPVQAQKKVPGSLQAIPGAPVHPKVRVKKAFQALVHRRRYMAAFDMSATVKASAAEELLSRRHIDGVPGKAAVPWYMVGEVR